MNQKKEYREIFIPMRIQPPHIGHIQLIKKASEISEKVIIMICDCSEINFKNPFYGIEREKMLDKSLKNLEINNVEIFQMPSTLVKNQWFDFIREVEIIDKDTVILSGNPFIIENFPKELNSKLVLKPEDIIEEDLIDINATKLRDMIKEGNKDWINFAASGTIYYDKHFNLKERLFSLDK